jgi:uncharacterized protein YcfJ
MNAKFSLLLLPLVVLAGCAVNAPPGPRVAVMPAPGKPFEQFAAEEQQCRGYAQNNVGGQTPGEASGHSVAGSAVVGTVIGAAAGSLLGGRHGTANGAGMGLITGTMIGAGQGARSAADTQRAYDIAFQQCMYAKGNQLPQAYQQRQVQSRVIYMQPGTVYQQQTYQQPYYQGYQQPAPQGYPQPSYQQPAPPANPSAYPPSYSPSYPPPPPGSPAPPR